MLRNSSTGYGLLAVFLHWGMALLIFALFGLGLWMVELDYYDTWYHQAPDLHKSFGLLVAFLWLIRLLWRCVDRQPEPEPNYKAWEHRLALIMHRLFYVLIALMIVAGYLISTAEDVGVSFFGWFEIPAVLTAFDQQADIAGWIHWALAWLIIVAAALHSAAALKHHFVDGDRTLLKMLGRKK